MCVTQFSNLYTEGDTPEAAWYACVCVRVYEQNLGRDERGHVILQPRTCEWEMRDSQMSVPEHITCVCVCACVRARACECMKSIVMPVRKTRYCEQIFSTEKKSATLAPLVCTCLA